MKKAQNTANTLGGRIREARNELGLSQDQLATALGFQSPTAISLIENGERGVPASLLPRAAEVLHRSVNYFLGQPEQVTDIKVALRADRDLTDEDKDALLRFIDLAKQRPDAR